MTAHHSTVNAPGPLPPSVDNPTGCLRSPLDKDGSPATPRTPSRPESSTSISPLPSADNLPTSTNNGTYTADYTRGTRVRVAKPAPPARQDRPLRYVDVLRNKAQTTGGGAKTKVMKLARRSAHWLHYVWLDIFFMLLILAVTYICLLFLPTYRFKHRAFPVAMNPISREWEGPVELSYPIVDFVVPVTLVAIALPAIAILVLASMQIWVRNAWDFTAGVLGMLKGLVVISLLQVILKRFIGKLRPNFMAYCLPVFSWPDSFLPNDNVVSFRPPTRLHSEAAPDSIMNRHRADPDDQNHHFEDIANSIPLGIIAAVLAYRSHYASLFDYATNHRYLPWSSSHTSLGIQTSKPAQDEQAEKKTYRFKNHGNLAAVAWPRQRRAPASNGDGQDSRITDTAPPAGVDGADERPVVTQLFRRRTGSELLNHRLAGPVSLRPRRSKPKYPFSKRMSWHQNVDGVCGLEYDRDITTMKQQSRAGAVSPMPGTGTRSWRNTREGQRSAGVMV
ncbi:MAG: hypothetical protein Q9217_003231 [Psora testacea]